MKEKKHKKYILAVLLPVIIIAAAAACIAGWKYFAGRAAEELSPEMEQEYQGTFPGIAGTTGIFSTFAPGASCRDFAVSAPAGGVLLNGSKALRRDDVLEIKEAVFADDRWPEIMQWAEDVTADGIVNTICGTWRNDYGKTGDFTFSGGEWHLESAETVFVYNSDSAVRKDTLPAIASGNIPEYPLELPYTPGNVQIERKYSVPGMALQRMTARSQKWELLATASGQWMLTRTAYAAIPEVPGITFNDLTASGGPDGNIRWSAGWIRKAVFAPNAAENILHIIAGNGLECVFSAFGTSGMEADWSMTAAPSAEHIILTDGMEMLLSECELENSSGSITGTLIVRDLVMPFAADGSVLCVPVAKIDVRSDGSMYCIALESAEIRLPDMESGCFVVEGASWNCREGKISDFCGASGRWNGLEWQRMSIDSEDGTGHFSGIVTTLPGGSFTAAEADMTSKRDYRTCSRIFTVREIRGTAGDFDITASSGSITVNNGRDIAGTAADCRVTSAAYPDFFLQNAAVEFSAISPESVTSFTCHIAGRVFDRDGLLADMEAEYYPQEELWRGKCTFLTGMGKLAAIVMRSAAGSSWIIPFGGTETDDFPAMLFPGWRGISLWGIGSFEFDVLAGTAVTMLDAGVRAGDFLFGNASGSWYPELGPDNPDGEFACSFFTVNIPGTAAGEVSGRYSAGKLLPDTFSAAFLDGSCEFIGLAGDNWIMDLRNISGEILTEVLLGRDGGSGWEGFTFNGGGIYSPRQGRWIEFSFSGVPADGSNEIRTAVTAATENMAEDATSDFFRDFLRDCRVSDWYLECDFAAGTLTAAASARPEAPLNYIFSGDAERPFTVPEAGEPGFYGKIELQIDLPLCTSNDILFPKEF